MSVEAMLGVQQLRARTTHACFRVLMTLAEHADKLGQNAYPAIDTIAEEAQTDEKTVRRCLATLQADKLIVGEKGRGRSRTHCWSLNFPIPTLGKEGVRPGNQAVDPAPIEGATPGITPVKEGLTPVKEGLTPVKEGLTPPEPVLNLSTTKQVRKSSLRSQRAQAEPTAFNAWWAQYPRKVGRDAASKSYATAVNRGATDAQLLLAVQRTHWPDETRFVPHPATWLNQGRWKDEQPPSRAGPAAASKHSWMARELGLTRAHDDFAGVTLEPELQH